MKIVLIAALALLLGLFLGGFGPRSDLRRAREDLAEARAAADRARAGSAAPIALGALFAARERANERALPAPAATAGPAAGSPGPSPSPDPDDAPDAGRPDGGRRGLRALADDDAFKAAKSAADLRAAQFKAAFLEEANLDGGQQKQLDDVTKKMNEEFEAEAEKIADMVADKGDRLTPRDMADIGVKLLQVYQRADDGLQGFLSDAQRAAADKAKFDLLTQIDVASFKKLAEAAAKLDRPPERLR